MRSNRVCCPGYGFLGMDLNGCRSGHLLGDLDVLPRFGKLTAAIGDVILASVLAYAISLLMPWVSIEFLPYAVFAILIALGEYFFHMYLVTASLKRPAIAGVNCP
jgi:hypothetical protein